MNMFYFDCRDTEVWKLMTAFQAFEVKGKPKMR